MEKREKMMVRQQRDQWPLSPFLTSLVFLVAISSLLSACGFSTPSTQTPVIKTVYLMRQNGSVDALQASTGSIRWHHQFDQQDTISSSLLADPHVVYVGRVDRTYSGYAQAAYKGSVDALKASNGAVLWHLPINVHNDSSQPVQVMTVID